FFIRSYTDIVLATGPIGALFQDIFYRGLHDLKQGKTVLISGLMEGRGDIILRVEGDQLIADQPEEGDCVRMPLVAGIEALDKEFEKYKELRRKYPGL
ncbi:MAG: hypothetical protein AAFV53_43135, partial [Myxococcota bacterium]